MKIVSLSVVAFGKLKDVNLDFRDGVNVINNINGFGKTTLANFIRAMLYGLNYTKSKGVSDVTRFSPWDGIGKYGGSMTVEHNGEQYRVERFFGSAAKHETLTVINLKTNKPILFDSEVGEYFLGLTADSYDRSAYFPQEAVELSANDNLESRLANLVENGAEDYDKVQENLRKYRKTLKYEKGQGGKIFELEMRERQLSIDLNCAVLAEKRSVDIEKRLREIHSEQDELSLQQSELNLRAAALQKKLAQLTLSPEETANAEKLNELELKLSRIPIEIEQDKRTLDELENRISSVKNDVKPRVYPKLSLLIASVILAIIGIVLFFVVPKPYGIIAGAVALALAAAGIITSVLFKGAKTLPAGEKDALISDYYRIASKYVYVNDLDYNKAVKAFWRTYSDYQGDVRARDALMGITRKHGGGSIELESQLNETNHSLNVVVRRINELSEEVGSLSQERKSLVSDRITPQEQLLTVRAERDRLSYRYDVTGKVMELLANAKENLSSSYLPRLCERCQSLLSFVTNRKYEVVIDRAFNVKIRENGQTKAMSDFSRGIREITLLCFRIALSELLYDKQIPFVIIDDAFVNFDEDNFERATNLLKKVSERGQVIYLTCHNRTGNLLK